MAGARSDDSIEYGAWELLEVTSASVAATGDIFLSGSQRVGYVLGEFLFQHLLFFFFVLLFFV